MASIIIALFDCPDEAQRVAARLEQSGVPADDVHCADGGPADAEGLAETLTQLGVPRDDAANHQDGVASGGALLLVRAEDDTAGRVRALIDGAVHGAADAPGEAATRDAAERIAACDSAETGQAAGGYGTRGGATAFGGIQRVPAGAGAPAKPGG